MSKTIQRTQRAVFLLEGADEIRETFRMVTGARAVTLRQYRVLRAIRRLTERVGRPPLMGDVKDELPGMPDLTRIVGRLARGRDARPPLVRRRRSEEDGRYREVVLLEAGRALLEELDEEIARTLPELVGRLRATLGPLLCDE